MEGLEGFEDYKQLVVDRETAAIIEACIEEGAEYGNMGDIKDLLFMVATEELLTKDEDIDDLFENSEDIVIGYNDEHIVALKHAKQKMLVKLNTLKSDKDINTFSNGLIEMNDLILLMESK